MYRPHHRPIQPIIHIDSDNRRPSVHSISGVIQAGSPEIISLLTGPSPLPHPISISRQAIWTYIPSLIGHIDRSTPSMPFIHLPREHPYVWCIIAYWADQDALPPLLDAMIAQSRRNPNPALIPGNQAPEMSNNPDLLVEIYLVAQRFLIERLEICVLQALEYVHVRRHDPKLPSVWAYNTVWGMTRGRLNQGIRHLFRDWCFALMRSGTVGAEVLAGMNAEVVAELWLMKRVVRGLGEAAVEAYWEAGNRLVREGYVVETGMLVGLEYFRLGL